MINIKIIIKIIKMEETNLSYGYSHGRIWMDYLRFLNPSATVDHLTSNISNG